MVKINGFSTIIQKDDNPKINNSQIANKNISLTVEKNNIQPEESVSIGTNFGLGKTNFSFVTNKPETDPISEALDKIEEAETNDEKFNLLTDILLKSGGKIDNLPEHRNIVGFRQPNLPSENNKKGVYDDVTFVFWKDKNGDKKVERFQSNTDPNGLFTDSRPNGDFGRIKAGKTYTFGFSYSNALGQTLRPTNKLDIERFSPSENKFKPAKTTLEVDKTFLFHDGLNIESNTYSMGCQTFPRIYDKETKKWDFVFYDLWNTLNGDDTKNRQKQINYTILQLPEN